MRNCNLKCLEIRTVSSHVQAQQLTYAGTESWLNWNAGYKTERPALLFNVSEAPPYGFVTEPPWLSWLNR